MEAAGHRPSSAPHPPRHPEPLQPPAPPSSSAADLHLPLPRRASRARRPFVGPSRGQRTETGRRSCEGSGRSQYFPLHLSRFRKIFLQQSDYVLITK
jgi:hypothetical protein